MMELKFLHTAYKSCHESSQRTLEKSLELYSSTRLVSIPPPPHTNGSYSCDCPQGPHDAHAKTTSACPAVKISGSPDTVEQPLPVELFLLWSLDSTPGFHLPQGLLLLAMPGECLRIFSHLYLLLISQFSPPAPVALNPINTMRTSQCGSSILMSVLNFRLKFPVT